MTEKTKIDPDDFLRIPVWYPSLASHTFLTSFVKLSPEAIQALQKGLLKGPVVQDVIEQLRPVMAAIPGNAFVGVDVCAPTDTERFYGKRGAVFSPESAWKYLALSRKVQLAAAMGRVEYIFARPFRRMSKPREFRLFLIVGKLNAMSQYHLIRHFKRLEGVKQQYWKAAKKFIKKIAWLLPPGRLVMDIYFTSDGQILIIDLNKWGECDPLMLRRWDRDWNTETGIVLMPPPTRISGDVNVSF